MQLKIYNIPKIPTFWPINLEINNVLVFSINIIFDVKISNL